MHIPFSGNRDRVVQDVPHRITLEDRSNVEASGDAPYDGPDPSPPLHRGVLPSMPRHGHDEPAMRHAVTVANGVVDVLHENQRGSFLCGIPLFSAGGLWVTDPPAWTNIDHSYSPFTIFSATVPDPTWEWVWKRWFVDMSGDVDENGWVYNINFTRHHWHGHHIWYHSFVRRRRWFRKRRKTTRTDRASVKAKNPALEDYFTIYSGTHRKSNSSQHTRGGEDFHRNDDDSDEESIMLENLGDFYAKLRAARLDREKLDAVDNFLRNGRDLEALAGEMKKILRFMVFQESRRHLLTILAQRCQEMEKRHEDGSGAAGPSDDVAHSHQCVVNAIDVAELLIAKLDYQSDRMEVSHAQEEAELDRLLALRLESHRAAKEERAKNARHLPAVHEGQAMQTGQESCMRPTDFRSRTSTMTDGVPSKLKRTVSFQDPEKTETEEETTKEGEKELSIRGHHPQFAPQEKGKGRKH